MPEEVGIGEKIINKIVQWGFAPSSYIKENVIEPLRKDVTRPNYYHRRFRRVPAIDECYTDDVVCYHEANEQFKRDKMVDERILNILRQRYINCEIYERDDSKRKCRSVFDEYEVAETNFYIKYGELGATTNVYKAFMKQKHRMVYERRHPEWKQW